MPESRLRFFNRVVAFGERYNLADLGIDLEFPGHL
jgi:hypothetical protein